MLERLYLFQVLKYINRKDLRAAKNWCLKHGVPIYKDLEGNDFVNFAEFELVYDMPVILSLKEKYGDEWQVFYDYYNRNELHKLLDLGQKPIEIRARYVPKGTIAINARSNL